MPLWPNAEGGVRDVLLEPLSPRPVGAPAISSLNVSVLAPEGSQLPERLSRAPSLLPARLQNQGAAGVMFSFLSQPQKLNKETGSQGTCDRAGCPGDLTGPGGSREPQGGCLRAVLVLGWAL